MIALWFDFTFRAFHGSFTVGLFFLSRTFCELAVDVFDRQAVLSFGCLGVRRGT